LDIDNRPGAWYNEPNDMAAGVARSGKEHT